jgi:hypothetical protein
MSAISSIQNYFFDDNEREPLFYRKMYRSNFCGAVKLLEPIIFDFLQH